MAHYFLVLMIFVASLVVSLAGGACLIKHAKKLGVLKYPKGRDAHRTPIATSGGIFIILPIVVAAIYLQLPAWLPVGLVIFTVMGWLDDRHDISFLKKFLVQALFVFVVLYCWLPLPPVRGVFSFLQYIFPDGSWVITNFVLWVIFSVGFINFFNFMDGSDGQAATGALLMLFGGWFFSNHGLLMHHTAVEYFLLAVGGALFGFLILNRPRARLFMGDTGSLPMGFLLVAMMWLVAQGDARQLGLWLILGAIFFTDSIVTIVTLAWRRQRFWLPHNVFAFQKILRLTHHNHWATLLMHVGYSLFWLYPVAYLWQRYPELSYAWFLCAYTPIFLLCLWVGAGRQAKENKENKENKTKKSRR